MELLGPDAPEIDLPTLLTWLGEASPPVLVDVRQPREYRRGHIAGVLSLPLTEVSRRLHELPRERPLVLICRTGQRSRSVARSLRRSGFHSFNLQGGMLNWQRNNLPVETATDDEHRA